MAIFKPIDELLKDAVPPYAWSWNANTKEWRVDANSSACPRQCAQSGTWRSRSNQNRYRA